MIGCLSKKLMVNDGMEMEIMKHSGDLARTLWTSGGAQQWGRLRSLDVYRFSSVLDINNIMSNTITKE